MVSEVDISTPVLASAVAVVTFGNNCVFGGEVCYLRSPIVTWSPLNVHEPNFILHSCWSNGKYVTSMVQELL